MVRRGGTGAAGRGVVGACARLRVHARARALASVRCWGRGGAETVSGGRGEGRMKEEEGGGVGCLKPRPDAGAARRGRVEHRRSGSSTASCACRPALAASTADAGPPSAVKAGLSETHTDTDTDTGREGGGTAAAVRAPGRPPGRDRSPSTPDAGRLSQVPGSWHSRGVRTAPMGASRPSGLAEARGPS